MRKFKKFASTALALAMILSMGVTAYAAPDTDEPKVDELIGVEGLQANDVVKFYKILEWIPGEGWAATDRFSSLSGSIEEIAHGARGDDGTVKPGEISFALAGEIAALATGNPDVSVDAVNGRATISDPEPGLYVGIIQTAEPGYFYNPVFVAADFNPDNTILSLSDTELSYQPQSHAKVNVIGLEKEADKDTANVGDIVSFTVTTMVPVYAENYTSPVFRLTDVLSDGLMITAGSVVAEGIDADAYSVEYTETGYVLTVSPTYLKNGERQNTSVTITYTATVTNEAVNSINQDENTVTLEYSNSPSDETGAGRLRDRTVHYTFDIDGFLTGQDGYTSSELVKIGVDASGNEITDTVELDNGSVIGALSGAKFTLYSDEACETVYKNTDFDGTELISDSKGYIPMKGLDAGTYWLVETEAPNGYIKFQDKVKIEIIVPDECRTEVEVKDVDDDGTEVTYKVTVITGYEVWITVGNGPRTNTATYNLTNKSEGTKLISADKGDKVGNTGTLDEHGQDVGGKILNTVGVELPSTGGIGTTIFYIVGGCLVLGAGVLLVVKKRVGGKDEA